MSFKKFVQYIKEKNLKDIEDVYPESSKGIPGEDLNCSKCGEPLHVCLCTKKDYYNAKNPQWTPKSKLKKSKNGKDTKFTEEE